MTKGMIKLWVSAGGAFNNNYRDAWHGPETLVLYRKRRSARLLRMARLGMGAFDTAV